MDLQDIILKLDRYCAKQGCAVTPAGAGSVISGAAGPGALCLAGAACLPESGPDGRYRYRVFFRCAPRGIRRFFLGCLGIAGIDRSEHDLRWLEAGRGAFPAGTSGLGWEVLLDGQPLAFFAYLQKAGEVSFRPSAVWLDISIERLALASQRRTSVSDLVWSGGLTYGALHREQGDAV